MPDQLLDARGLKCPLPVMRAQKALRAMAAGATLEVHSTDDVSAEDFPDFCRANGHELVSARRDGRVWVFIIRKVA